MAKLRKELSPHFLTDTTIKILRAKKIFTITDFLDEDPKNLALKTNLNYQEIIQLRQSIISNFGAFPINAVEAYKDYVKYSSIISSGIPRVDVLLDGGLLTGELLEICGPSGSGKTQFCLTVAANVALKLKKRVYYIDCKSDFSGIRMQSILDSYEPKDEELGKAMERIQVVQPTSANQLLLTLPTLYEEIQRQRDLQCVTHVLIIDSLPALFYPYLGNKKAFGMLNTLGIALKQLACEQHVAVVVVNLATMWREDDDDTQDRDQELKPAFGKLWLSVPNLRMCLVRDDGSDTIKLSVMKSTRIKSNNSCSVKFSNKGLE